MVRQAVRRGDATHRTFSACLSSAESSYFIGAEDTLDTQTAAYGQADYDVWGGLKLTAGLRVADMKYTNSTLTEGPIAGGTNASGGNQDEHPVTPKAGVEYQMNQNVLLYASASKGFRPGGSNIIVSSECGANLAELGLKEIPPSYGSDQTWSDEVGDKSNLADGRLQIASSLFWIDWQDIQQNILLPACASEFVGNLGAAVSKGFDLQTQIRPLPGLTVGLSGGYTDAAYTKTTAGGSGRSLPRGVMPSACPSGAAHSRVSTISRRSGGISTPDSTSSSSVRARIRTRESTDMSRRRAHGRDQDAQSASGHSSRPMEPIGVCGQCDQQRADSRPRP